MHVFVWPEDMIPPFLGSNCFLFSSSVIPDFRFFKEFSASSDNSSGQPQSYLYPDFLLAQSANLCCPSISGSVDPILPSFSSTATQPSVNSPSFSSFSALDHPSIDHFNNINCKNNRVYSSNPSFFDGLGTNFVQHAYSAAVEKSSKVGMMGTVDTGCTTMIIPLSLAKMFDLTVLPLTDPFTMHFAEIGASSTISLGIHRDSSYVWDFIAVSDKISQLLIDIKQPVRCGYALFADSERALLVENKFPFTVYLSGLVSPNGTYQWNLREVLNLKRLESHVDCSVVSVLPRSTNNINNINDFNNNNSTMKSVAVLPSVIHDENHGGNLLLDQHGSFFNSPHWQINNRQIRLLAPFINDHSSRPVVPVSVLEHGARRHISGRKDLSGLGFEKHFAGSGMLKDQNLSLAESFVQSSRRVDKICWQCRQNLLAVSTKFVGSFDKLCWQCRQNLLAVSTKFVGSVDKICW
jgi:hypothetical protein